MIEFQFIEFRRITSTQQSGSVEDWCTEQNRPGQLHRHRELVFEARNQPRYNCFVSGYNLQQTRQLQGVQMLNINSLVDLFVILKTKSLQAATTQSSPTFSD